VCVARFELIWGSNLTIFDVIHFASGTVGNLLGNKIKRIGSKLVDKFQSANTGKKREVWLVSASFELLYRTAEHMQMQKACMGMTGTPHFYVVSAKTHRLFKQVATRYEISTRGKHSRKNNNIIVHAKYNVALNVAHTQCPGFGTRLFFSSAERQRIVWHLLQVNS
jgi:hypothetical protein